MDTIVLCIMCTKMWACYAQVHGYTWQNTDYENAICSLYFSPQWSEYQRGQGTVCFGHLYMPNDFQNKHSHV